MTTKTEPLKQFRDLVLKMKDKETKTKAQLLQELEPFLDQELEKLMREGEIFFPKKGVITRIC